MLLLLVWLQANTKFMNQTFNQIETVKEYLSSKRWSDIKRDYSVDDICSLRPSFKVEHSLSEIGSELLMDLLSRKDSWVSGLGAATAQQALQMFHLDYEIIYVSGWLSLIHISEPTRRS